MEIWKDIEGHEGLYQVSNLGRILSLPNKTHSESIILKFLGGRGNYNYISLYKDGRSKTMSVHRIVAKAFIPNPDNKPEVNHTEGIQNDNTVEHLEWATRSENQLHRFRVLNQPGTFKNKFGSEHHSSKPVHQFDVNGNLLNTFQSTREAARILNKRHSSIAKCASGKKKHKSAYGFKWSYALNS
jgi:hypothetical protein